MYLREGPSLVTVVCYGMMTHLVCPLFCLWPRIPVIESFMENESHTQMPTETRQTCELVRQSRHKIIGNGGKYMEIQCMPCLNRLVAPQLQPTVLQEGRFTTARPFIFFKGKQKSRFLKLLSLKSMWVKKASLWLVTDHGCECATFV